MRGSLGLSLQPVPLDLDPCTQLHTVRKGLERHSSTFPQQDLLLSTNFKWVKPSIKVHRDEFYPNFIFLCLLKIISQLPLPSGQSSRPPQRSRYQIHLQPPPPFRHFSRLRSLIISPLFQPGLQPGKNKPAGLAKAEQRQPNYRLPHCSFGPAGALLPLSPLLLAASEQLPLTPRHAAGQNEVFALKMLVPRARARQRRRVPAEGTPGRSPGLEASPLFCTWDVIILVSLTFLNSTLRQMTYQQHGILFNCSD